MPARLIQSASDHSVAHLVKTSPVPVKTAIAIALAQASGKGQS